MDLNLRGKSVLITGASKGIGLACAIGFAAEGCRLHIASRDAAALKEVSKTIAKDYNVEVICHPCDLSLTTSVVELSVACSDIDILVNNAGAVPNGGIDQVAEEQWRHGWDLKVFGYINLTRQLYGYMRSRRAGVIINVIGVAGERPRPEYIAGSTGNAALMAFTRALGAESVDHGIRVVGVNPGGVETERLIATLMDTAEKKLGDRSRWKEIQARSAETLPFKRLARPDEIADAVVYLSSSRASYISATVITIDAGQSMRNRFQ